MIATLDALASLPTPESSEDPIPVVIAYDDEHAYRRAIRLVVRTARQLKDEGHFRPQPWSFSALESPQLREYACAGARRSPILLISVSGTELPESARAWLNAHSRHTRGSDALLIALFGPQSQRDNHHRPMLEFLHSIATRAGYEFLAPSVAPEPEATLCPP